MQPVQLLLTPSMSPNAPICEVGGLTLRFLEASFSISLSSKLCVSVTITGSGRKTAV